MSDYQAIAAVSATLKALLEDRMVLTASTQPPNQRVAITISHPDVKPSAPPSGPRLNLFLYEVAHSPFLRNQELTGPGGVGFPPLALELHFLITCFPVTPDDDQTVQLVLGDALRVLHDTPLISDRLVRTRGFAAGDPLLHPALQGAFEQVKLTFHPQSMEIASKLWQSLKEPYRLSAAFSVSVVQIESQRSFVQAPPVRDVRVNDQPGPPPPPSVLTVSPLFTGVGQLITVAGTNLGTPTAQVHLNAVPCPIIKSSAGELVVSVPDHAALQPGKVQVDVYSRPEVLVDSAAFTLVPRLTGATLAESRLTITGFRLLSPDQSTTVLVGDQSFAPDPASTEKVLVVTLPGPAPSGFTVQVQVGSTHSIETLQVSTQ